MNGLGYIISERHHGHESLAGIVISRDHAEIAIEALLLKQQPSSLIPALHFMELIYAEHLADSTVERIIAHTQFVDDISVPYPELRELHLTNGSHYDPNIILLSPNRCHEPALILETYASFVLSEYRKEPVKPRGILIPQVNYEDFRKAVDAAEDNLRTGASNLASALSKDRTVMCYHYSSSRSKILSHPRHMPHAKLREFVSGY